MRKRRRQYSNSERGGLTTVISRYPREFVGLFSGTVAVIAVFTNALFLQHGPHPAPIFATRSLAAPAQPVALPPPRLAGSLPAPEAPAHSRMQLIGDIQGELNRRGFYDGTADGIWGAKTDAAVRDFVQAAALKIKPEASDGLLQAIAASGVTAKAAPEPVRSDPIAKLIAPPTRVLAVQRALADFGYGQIKLNGIEDADTHAAIEKFERDRRLPVTGNISDRLVRELAAMTGRPLE